MAPELSLESRIIAVADVYSALSEDRPYRASLDLDEIVSIMTKIVPDKLDAVCFDALVSTVSDSSALMMPSSMLDAESETDSKSATIAFA
jgi:HD-GYP domain-containing protein (c-di-GMP phosphodiesterase class II)